MHISSYQFCSSSKKRKRRGKNRIVALFSFSYPYAICLTFLLSSSTCYKLEDLYIDGINCNSVSSSNNYSLCEWYQFFKSFFCLWGCYLPCSCLLSFRWSIYSGYWGMILEFIFFYFEFINFVCSVHIWSQSDKPWTCCGAWGMQENGHDIQKFWVSVDEFLCSIYLWQVWYLIFWNFG